MFRVLPRLPRAFLSPQLLPSVVASSSSNAVAAVVVVASTRRPYSSPANDAPDSDTDETGINARLDFAWFNKKPSSASLNSVNRRSVPHQLDVLRSRKRMLLHQLKTVNFHLRRLTAPIAAFSTTATASGTQNNGVRLRSLLFVPGNQRRMLERSLASGADVVLPDMEDSVPPAEKLNARKLISESLPWLHTELGGRAQLLPRVNGLDTGLTDDDIEAVAGPHILGISIGKIESAADMNAVAASLLRCERALHLPENHLKIIPWIETARGVLRAGEICQAHPQRLIGVAFGAEDYTNSIGVRRTLEGTEVAFARNMVALAAQAAGVTALDTPWTAFKDLDGLRRDADTVKQMGYRGKFAIHPGGIGIINEVFSPSAEEIEHALRVVEASDRAEREGRGSTSLDGHMVDVPVVKRARQLLRWAGKL